jgi:chromosomal replication initiation ATPase DnaA
MSLPQIGHRLGNRDHTTVLHGVRRYEAKLRGEVYRQPTYGKALEAAGL